MAKVKTLNLATLLFVLKVEFDIIISFSLVKKSFQSVIHFDGFITLEHSTLFELQLQKATIIKKASEPPIRLKG
jgi:hypothetical protein